jgi:hypothetical protein
VQDVLIPQDGVTGEATLKRNQGTAKQGETGRAVDGDGDARAKQTLGDDTMTGVMYSMALQPKSFVFSSTKCIDMFFFSRCMWQ